mgnify:CR=1 FL=1
MSDESVVLSFTDPAHICGASMAAWKSARGARWLNTLITEMKHEGFIPTTASQHASFVIDHGFDACLWCPPLDLVMLFLLYPNVGKHPRNEIIPFKHASTSVFVVIRRVSLCPSMSLVVVVVLVPWVCCKWSTRASSVIVATIM